MGKVGNRGTAGSSPQFTSHQHIPDKQAVSMSSRSCPFILQYESPSDATRAVPELIKELDEQGSVVRPPSHYSSPARAVEKPPGKW